MSLLESLLTIVLLIAASSFFSIAEISLAASRKLRLRQMVDEGDARAGLVIRTQEQPGEYFTVVQIGVNAVAILGGVVGEGALTPYFSGWLTPWLAPETAATVGFDNPAGQPRFTFGNVDMMAGIPFICAMIGLSSSSASGRTKRSAFSFR